MRLPDVQIDYFDYLPRKKPDKMLWHYFREKMPNIESYDLVLVFTGVAPSDDSGQFDRAGNQLAGYIEDVMRNVAYHNPNCALILCSGSSPFKSPKADLFPAIVQMWPTGEGAGQAIAEVLTGVVNPSGKLSLAICMQSHGTGMHISLGRVKYPGDEEDFEGDRDCAVQAVQKGFAALAIEQRAMGEGGSKADGTPNCAHPAYQAIMLGRTIIGERCHDVSCA